MFVSWIDLIVGSIVVISAYFSTERGGVRELFTLLVWIISAGLALIFAPVIRDFITKVPIPGKVMESCIVSLIVSYCVLFGASVIVLSFTVSVGMNKREVGRTLRFFDHLMGFSFGVLRGFFLLAMAYLVYSELIPEESIPTVMRDSFSVNVIVESSDFISSLFPREVPDWLGNRISLMMKECSSVKNELESIDGFEKFNIEDIDGLEGII